MAYQKACLILFLLFGIACSNNEQAYNQIPNVAVFLEFKTTDLNYQQLQTQGWQYVNGGVRGLLLVKDGGIYRAFDRNCPYQPADECATVNMHSSGLYIVDEDCCYSTFDKSGQPTGGPASFALRAYTVAQDGNYLNIYN